jgi:hypothetical protein
MSEIATQEKLPETIPKQENTTIVPGKRSVGKPRIFGKPEEMEARIEEYFDKCEKRTINVFLKDKTEPTVVPSPKIPTIAELAAELGMDRMTFYNYAERDEYIDIIKKARNRILAAMESSMINDDKPKAGIIFVAKNYGYTDAQEITHRADFVLQISGLRQLPTEIVDKVGEIEEATVISEERK